MRAVPICINPVGDGGKRVTTLILFNLLIFDDHAYMMMAAVNKSILRVWDFFAAEIAAQRTHLFLWWPVFLGLGIGVYFVLRFEPPVIVSVGGFLLSVGLCFISRFKTPLFLLCLTALGFSAAQMHAQWSYTPMLEKETRPTQMEATIHTIEHLEPGAGSRIVFRNLQVEDLEPERTPVRVRLRVRKDEGLKPGQRVKALVKLMPPSPPILPGGFDFQRYMYFRQIGAVGFVFNAPEILEEPRGRWQDFSETVRERIGFRVKAALEHPDSAVAQALITAERGEIPESDRQAMRDSGLAHLLAISGLHVGLFSGVVFFLVRLALALVPGMALKYPIKKYAAVLAFAAACFYAFLAGAPISTQRALIMVGVVFLAILLDRSPFSMRLISLAAFLVLLFSPESLTSASFHMSFGAVAGLIAFYEFLRPYSMGWYRQSGIGKRIALYFVGTILTTVIATLATAPFVLFHFQQMPTYSVLANVLAVPLMAFVVMPSAVLALFLMPMGLEYWPLQMMGEGIHQILVVAHWFAEIPGAVLKVPIYPVSALILFILGVLVFMLWQGYLRFAAVILIFIAFLQINIDKQYNILVSSDFNLVFLRDHQGEFYISSRRKEKFVAENWEKAYALEPGTAKRWPKEGQIGDLTCDPAACRLELHGAQISFLRQPYALQAECHWAQAVISLEVLDGAYCKDVILKDRFNGYRAGVHAFRVEDGKITYDTVEQFRGQRPWIPGDQ